MGFPASRCESGGRLRFGDISSHDRQKERLAADKGLQPVPLAVKVIEAPRARLEERVIDRQLRTVRHECLESEVVRVESSVLEPREEVGPLRREMVEVITHASGEDRGLSVACVGMERVRADSHLEAESDRK